MILNFILNKLIFFEGSESALMSIDLIDNNENPIYYYDIQIAISLRIFKKNKRERSVLS